MGATATAETHKVTREQYESLAQLQEDGWFVYGALPNGKVMMRTFDNVSWLECLVEPDGTTSDPYRYRT